MTSNNELNTDQKVIAIQKEVEEATALELPMLQKNLVFLSTITSVGTLVALLGTVMGMIRSFSALGSGEGGGGAAASALAVGISEALYNTALGIGTSALRLLCIIYLQLRSMLLLTVLMNQGSLLHRALHLFTNKRQMLLWKT
jgi:biopolymer transport protein ExbB